MHSNPHEVAKRHELQRPIRPLRILHPILFAVYPVLFLYAYNLGLLEPKVLVLPLVITIAIVLALWTGLGYLLRHREKVALLVTALVLWFFFYGHVYQGLGISIRHRYSLTIWSIPLAVVAVFLIRTRRSLADANRLANVVAGALVAMS